MITRPTLLSVLLLCGALAAVVGGVWGLHQRDRRALVERFALERQQSLDAAVRGVADALEDVGDDLRFASELLVRPGSPREHERELRALLEVGGQYKAIGVYGGDGAPHQVLVDRRASSEVRQGVAFPTMAQTAHRALARTPGDVVASPQLPGAKDGWLRVFATALPPQEGQPWGAVAVLVDSEPLFAPLRLVVGPPEGHLLILGTLGQPAPDTEPQLADWHRRLAKEGEKQVPTFTRMVAAMRAGKRGTLRIPEEEAQRLGLGAAEAVASFVPIQVKGGAHWSVASLGSTTAIASLERALFLRLTLAALLVTLFVGLFVGYVVLANRRAAALEESRRHAERLAHLHEKTQKILDHIPTGVLALGADGRIGAVNRALSDRLPPDSVGRGLGEAFARAPAAVVERLSGLVTAAQESGRVVSVHGEPLALFGEEGTYSLHAVPLAHNEPDVRVLLVVEDLSNVRALEGQLLRAEKLGTVGILAAGIAHEVGTPLGVVRGRAEYILGKLGEGHPQGPGVSVIIEQIDRVSRTIRQLLDFSRVQPALVRPVALGASVKSVAELLRLEALRRKVTLVADVPEALAPVAADPDQLQQVLVNLTLNALDACAPGGQVTVAAGEVPSDGPEAWRRVKLTITDDGCGIPPEDLARVFDPFYTTKKRGQGTGLGLTTVAHIVRNHGGQVELDSTVGRGTCVSVLWPVAGAKEAEGRHAV